VLGETLIEHLMLASVHLLLTDESLDIGAQLRISDLVTHRCDRADEELLAFRKRRRQDREDMTQDDVAVDGEVLGKIRDPLVELHRSHGNLRGPRRDLITGWKVGTGSAHVHPAAIDVTLNASRVLSDDTQSSQLPRFDVLFVEAGDHQGLDLFG
jgi:hypothetical protein